MKRKLIHILCHSLENDKTLDHHVFGNWAARLAKNIQIYSNKYDQEVWYAIRNLNSLHSYSKSKIVYKLFPAKSFSPILESYFAIIKCPSLFEELNKQDPQNTLIHFQGERGSLLHDTLSKYHQFKVTIQYHGYGQPSWLDWVERLFVTPLEKKNFKNVAHFFVHIKRRIGYLKNIIHINPSKMDYHNVGIDFNLFKPRSKSEARKKLSIAKNKFIIIYVGRMVRTKGVDKIINAYQILKKKYSNLYLLLVGASKSDPLYLMANKVADKTVDVLDYKMLPTYYNASNVYCFFGDEKTTDYAGPTTALMEALASNLNAVSTNLIHFPDKIVNKIGLIPGNFLDFVRKIEYLIKNPKIKYNARNKVARYTDYKYQTTHLLNVYDQLFKKKY